MSDLKFRDRDEAVAWDMYVAGVLNDYSYESAARQADMMIIERRKRQPTGATSPDDPFIWGVYNADNVLRDSFRTEQEAIDYILSQSGGFGGLRARRQGDPL